MNLLYIFCRYIVIMFGIFFYFNNLSISATRPSEIQKLFFSVYTLTGDLISENNIFEDEIKFAREDKFVEFGNCRGSSVDLGWADYPSGDEFNWNVETNLIEAAYRIRNSLAKAELIGVSSSEAELWFVDAVKAVLQKPDSLELLGANSIFYSENDPLGSAIGMVDIKIVNYANLNGFSEYELGYAEGCGAGGVLFRIVGDDILRAFSIPEGYYRICELLGTNPLDFSSCRRWLELPVNTPNTIELSGIQRIVVERQNGKRDLFGPFNLNLYEDGDSPTIDLKL